jgi:hypothetical protein
MRVGVLSILLVQAVAVHHVPSGRRALLRGAAVASAGCLLPALPRSARADRGKDLFETDGAILSGGGSRAEQVVVPKFDENGALIDGNGYGDVTEYREVASGGASVQVLKNWVTTDGGGLKDPVTGTVASQLRLQSSPTTLASITDLGRPEQLSLVSDLSLEEELKKADLVAAAKRIIDGLVFYDFDLALPEAKCDGTMATACLPSLVVLLSAVVRDGKLHVVRVDAGPGEWCAAAYPFLCSAQHHTEFAHRANGAPLPHPTPLP